MPGYRVPNATRPIPRNAPWSRKHLTAARPDGSRIEIGLYGPVYRPNSGMFHWIGVTVENRDGTTRRAWSRQYSRRNVWRALDDYAAMEHDLRDGGLTLPDPCLETA